MDDVCERFTQAGVVLLYDPAEAAYVDKALLPLFDGHVMVAQPWRTAERLPLAAGAAVAVFVDDEALTELLPQAAREGWWLGVLPHPRLKRGAAAFRLSSTLEEAVEDLLGCEQPLLLDLFRCNDRPVLHSVVIGDVSNWWSNLEQEDDLAVKVVRFLRLIRSFRTIRLHSFSIATNTSRRLETAALGIVAVEHGSSSFLSRGILGGTTQKNGMLHALLVAPRSLTDIFLYLLSGLLPRERDAIRLPPFVGHVKTSALTVTTSGPISYAQDGLVRSAERFDLDVVPNAVRVAPSRRMRTVAVSPEPKEAFQVRAMPTGEACTELLARPLPFRRRAATDDFKDLFVLLRQGARLSGAYLTLMVLSTLLATLGLFASSGPVIIGAMILAPLMAPIISLAMGTLRQDEALITTSARTLVLGVLLALSCASLLTWILPLKVLNAEISARMHPTLLDLGVAVIAGIAGAYAHARAEVARSLAGVAIAVALVPPLAVVGIGIAWFDIEVFTGATLLFLTNLAGIVLSASLTFLLLGFSPFRRARQGLIISLVSVVAVSVPLAIGFQSMVVERNIVRMLEGWQIDHITLRHVSVARGRTTRVAAQLVSPTPLEIDEIDEIKKAVEARLGQKVQFEAAVTLVR